MTAHHLLKDSEARHAAPARVPRVLIVNGEPASASSATGITLGHLFENWPRAYLAQIYTAALPHELIGTIDYHVPANDRRNLSWLRLPSDSATLLACEKGDSAFVPAGRGRGLRLREAAKREGRHWLDLFPYELPGQIEQEIVRFRPHLIYSCLGNIQISRLALRLARLCRIPVIPHFMDDWVSTQYVGRPDLVLQRALLLHVLDSVLAAAPCGLTISDAMASEYSVKFRKPFHSFMNCVPVPTIPPPLPESSTRLRFVYVGGLQLNRWRALREIGNTLASLNREGVPGGLTVYAPAADLQAFSDKLAGTGVEIGGSLNPAEVHAAISAADVLVHVESFEPAMRRYTRLSISTKIPQYAAAARPVFCYGPPEVASLRFIHENVFGLVVGSQGGGELKAKLRRLLEDSRLRQEFSTNAFATARRHFDADSIQQRFQSVLSSAAISLNADVPAVS